jgi:hypothetical protein
MKNKKYVEGKKKVSAGLTPQRSSVSILRIQRKNMFEPIVIRRNRRHRDTSFATEQTTSAKHIIPWLVKRNLNIKTAANKNSTVQNNKSEQDEEIQTMIFQCEELLFNPFNLSTELKSLLPLGDPVTNNPS